MEQYPDLCVFGDDYDRVDLDGRRNSRTLDGRPRVQILWEGEQQEFSITHPQLNVSQVNDLLNFYRRNIVLEFEFKDPVDEKIYICMFYSAPKFSRFNMEKKDVTFKIAGYLKNG